MKFKVGDKGRIVSNTYDAYALQNQGAICAVEEVQMVGNRVYYRCVRVDGNNWAYNEYGDTTRHFFDQDDVELLNGIEYIYEKALECSK